MVFWQHNYSSDNPFVFFFTCFHLSSVHFLFMYSGWCFSSATLVKHQSVLSALFDVFTKRAKSFQVAQRMLSKWWACANLLSHLSSSWASFSLTTAGPVPVIIVITEIIIISFISCCDLLTLWSGLSRDLREWWNDRWRSRRKSNYLSTSHQLVTWSNWQHLSG